MEKQKAIGGGGGRAVLKKEKLYDAVAFQN